MKTMTLLKQIRIVVPLLIAMAITICGVIFYSLGFLRHLSEWGQIGITILAPAIPFAWIVTGIVSGIFNTHFILVFLLTMAMFSITFWFFSIRFTQVLYAKWKTFKKWKYLFYLVIWLLFILFYIGWTMIAFYKFRM